MARRKAKASQGQPLTAAQLDKTLEQFAKVEQLARMIACGKTYTECLDEARLMWPRESAVGLYDAAVEEMKKAASIDEETMRGFAIYATRDLYRRLVDGGDLVTALKAIKLLAELQSQ